MIYSNILERLYLFSTSGSEATRILGSLSRSPQCIIEFS